MLAHILTVMVFVQCPSFSDASVEQPPDFESAIPRVCGLHLAASVR